MKKDEMIFEVCKHAIKATPFLAWRNNLKATIGTEPMQ